MSAVVLKKVVVKKGGSVEDKNEIKLKSSE
jgi:hypothetical protein